MQCLAEHSFCLNWAFEAWVPYKDFKLSHTSASLQALLSSLATELYKAEFYFVSKCCICWHKIIIFWFRFLPVHFHSSSITMLFITFSESNYIASYILRYFWMGIFYTKTSCLFLLLSLQLCISSTPPRLIKKPKYCWNLLWFALSIITEISTTSKRPSKEICD